MRKRKKKENNTLNNVAKLGTGTLSGAATGFGLGYYSTQMAGQSKKPSKRIVNSAKKGNYGRLAGKGYAEEAKRLAEIPGSSFYDPIYKNSLITTIAQRRGAVLGGLGGAGFTGYQMYKNRRKNK